MEIHSGRVAAIHYTLSDDDGTVIDRSAPQSPLRYLHGAGNIVPGLEKALDGRRAGDSIQTAVPPEQGYGPRHDGLVQQVPRSAFPADARIEPGIRFEARTERGPLVVTVTEVGDEAVTVDGNHPLAGRTLHFQVEVAEVRDATEQERQQGHVAPDA
jgi:FKBP-type peptidyl-prolyl cis-trans isomerase SlyD